MKRLFLTTAIVAATALPLAAQSTDTNADMATVSLDYTGNMTVQASSLIGHRVYLPEGDDMSDDSQMMDMTDAPDTWSMAGEISDVILSTDGEVRGMIVDAGGFLGMNETERRINIDQVRFAQDTDDDGEYFIVFNGNADTFRESENYDQASATSNDEMRGNAMWDDGSDQSYEMVEMGSLTTDDLLGVAVYGSDDNWVGEISELTLGDDGNIDAAIIDVGGFLGIGEKPVRMTFDQIELRRTDGNELRAYVAATEDQLDGMDTWEANDA